MREAYRLEAATIALQWVLSGCPSSHLFVHALETLQRLLLPAVWLEAHALPALAPLLQDRSEQVRARAVALVSCAGRAVRDPALEVAIRQVCEECAASLGDAAHRPPLAPPMPSSWLIGLSPVNRRVVTWEEPEGELWVAWRWFQYAATARLRMHRI